MSDNYSHINSLDLDDQLENGEYAMPNSNTAAELYADFDSYLTGSSIAEDPFAALAQHTSQASASTLFAPPAVDAATPSPYPRALISASLDPGSLFFEEHLESAYQASPSPPRRSPMSSESGMHSGASGLSIGSVDPQQLLYRADSPGSLMYAPMSNDQASGSRGAESGDGSEEAATPAVALHSARLDGEHKSATQKARKEAIGRQRTLRAKRNASPKPPSRPQSSKRKRPDDDGDGDNDEDNDTADLDYVQVQSQASERESNELPVRRGTEGRYFCPRKECNLPSSKKVKDGFARLYDCKRHISTAHGENLTKVPTCEHCNKQFTRDYNLKRHLDKRTCLPKRQSESNSKKRKH